MKKMDSLGLRISAYQASLFELSTEKTACSSKIFIRRFMNSKLAERIDKEGIMFASLELSDALDEIEEQYGISKYGTEKFTSDEMHWIGYIYRYWGYTSGKSSKQIYKMMKPDQMRKLYFPYHSLDPLQAIERIQEAAGLEEEADLNDISRGVIVLRKVRNKYLK